MMNANAKGTEELDYPSLVFRQLDRIALLFCESGIYTKDGLMKSASRQNVYQAIAALEGLVRFKINNELLAKLDSDKERIGLKRFVLDRATEQSNLEYFNLVMIYIGKANLLPKERKSYSTGED